MSTPIVWLRDMDFSYGKLQPITANVRRLVCPNPSAFTFHGTGTYVIGHGQVIVVDPGPDMPEHIDTLLNELGDERVAAIAVTHTHRDHSPGAARLQQRTGAKTYGFGKHGEGRYQHEAEVEAGADLAFDPDVRLRSGDSLPFGDSQLTAVHTPGHCHNHLCFAVGTEGTLLTGDHVMGWSTSVISPPDGNMSDYLASLELLLMRNDTLLVPAHGPPIPDPKPYVKSLINHRHEREVEIRSCLQQGKLRITDMVDCMYRDVPAFLHPAAARSVLAHMLHMRARGEVACEGPANVDVVWRYLES